MQHRRGRQLRHCLESAWIYIARFVICLCTPYPSGENGLADMKPKTYKPSLYKATSILYPAVLSRKLWPLNYESACCNTASGERLFRFPNSSAPVDEGHEDLA